MKSDLTISEFARLMGVSTHQLRYFEEKGILIPKVLEANGYRLYGMEQVYTLSHILFLRQLNMPVSTIKTCLESYTPSDYQQLLATTVTQIEKQIKDLMALRQTTLKVIAIAESHSNRMNTFYRESFDERCLCQIAKLKHSEALTGRQLLEAVPKVAGDLPLFERDVIALITETWTHVCLEIPSESLKTKSAEPGKQHLLPAGLYLCYDFQAPTIEHYEEAVATFLNHIGAEHLRVSGHLIAVEQSIPSMLSEDGLLVQLQMRLLP